MGWSRHHQKRLIYSDPRHYYQGYTLFSNNHGGYHTNLVDMEGRVCHRWHSDEGIGYSVLLPNGNLLLRTHPPKDAGAAAGFPGGAAALLELDWESNVVWEYRNPMMPSQRARRRNRSAQHPDHHSRGQQRFGERPT